MNHTFLMGIFEAQSGCVRLEFRVYTCFHNLFMATCEVVNLGEYLPPEQFYST